jgi:tRNA(Arg) A34 adenosine deaminase TadA
MLRVSLKGKIANLKRCNILSYGFNSMGTDDKAGVHAEADALYKLKSNPNKKNPIPINILVIRVTKTNVLQTSKPCALCIEKLKRIPPLKGYRLDNIYYSQEPDKIVQTKMHILDSEEMSIEVRYKRRLAKKCGLTSIALSYRTRLSRGLPSIIF